MAVAATELAGRGHASWIFDMRRVLRGGSRSPEVDMSEASKPTISPEVVWVLAQLSEYALGDLENATLYEAPSRDRWFELMLGELDWEIEGGTQDEPKWAWEEHPWFSALGLTRDECHDWFDERNRVASSL